MMRVFCTLQCEKLHKWDGARKHKEVEYLANVHRHVFHFRVEVEVKHDDREVEFIMLKHEIESLVDSWGAMVGSCEMMCEDIYVHLLARFGPQRAYRIEIVEDNENGAVLEVQ